ncbi:hypothetical protein Bbelb_234410 [Branchiostoma belcheri]|nr:hypothetical protein Bbelb_234410 [Branchiostoma belcheri]
MRSPGRNQMYVIHMCDSTWPTGWNERCTLSHTTHPESACTRLVATHRSWPLGPLGNTFLTCSPCPGRRPGVLSARRSQAERHGAAVLGDIGLVPATGVMATRRGQHAVVVRHLLKSLYTFYPPPFGPDTWSPPATRGPAAPITRLPLGGVCESTTEPEDGDEISTRLSSFILPGGVIFLTPTCRRRYRSRHVIPGYLGGSSRAGPVDEGTWRVGCNEPACLTPLPTGLSAVCAASGTPAPGCLGSYKATRFRLVSMIAARVFVYSRRYRAPRSAETDAASRLIVSPESIPICIEFYGWRPQMSTGKTQANGPPNPAGPVAFSARKPTPAKNLLAR